MTGIEMVHVFRITGYRRHCILLLYCYHEKGQYIVLDFGYHHVMM